MKTPRQTIPTSPFNRLASQRWWDRTLLVAGVCVLLLLTVSPLFAPPAGKWRKGKLPPPSLNCKQRAQELREIYGALVDACKKADQYSTLTYLFKSDIRERYRRLLERWNGLKTECPSIEELGDMPCDSRTSQTTKGSSGPPSKPEKEYYKRTADECTRQIETTRNTGRVVASGFGFAAVVSPPEPINKAALLGAAAGVVLATEGLAYIATEKKNAWARLAADPPAPDYDRVIEPRIEPVVVPQTATELERSGLAMLQAHRGQVAYINAYTTSYERYQGALEAKDGIAMARQTEAMIQFALAAREQSQKAALQQYEYDSRIQALLEKGLKIMADKGIDPTDALAKWQKKLETDGLPSEIRKAMVAAGTADADIEVYRQQLMALTPKKFDEGLKALKSRVEVIAAVRECLNEKHSEASWPEPTEIGAIETMEYSARRLHQHVTETRIELSLKGVKEDITAEERPPWWAVPVGAPKRLDEDSVNLFFEDSGPLVPGRYDIYVRQGMGDQYQEVPLAVCLARGIQVEEGKPSKVLLQTGLRLELTKGSPKPVSWFVLACDASSTAIVAGRTGESLAPLWLLPGKYDVYWIQSLEHRKKPLLLARAVEVKENEVAAVTVGYSGIMLESASWIPKRDENHGWWGVVQTGDKPSYVVQQTASEDKLAVPIGKYDVYWVQAYEQGSAPMLIAKGVEVKENQLATVAAKSGIQLKLPKGTPALDANHGWWGVVSAGRKHEERINWSTGKFDLPLLVPPGTYDIFWNQNDKHEPQRIKQGVVVEENILLVVEAQPPKVAIP